MKCWRRLGWTVAVLVLLLTLLYASRNTCLPALAEWLDVGEKPHPAECIYILGGDASTRPLAAAVLVRHGLARRVLVPRVADQRRPRDKIFPAEHEMVREVLVRRGVPEAAIEYVGNGVTSTFDEARTLAAYLEDKPKLRVLVVTNGYHTRRARWVVNRMLGTQSRQVSLVSAPTDEISTETWWQSELGLSRVVGEWLKFLLYLGRYGDLLYWLGGLGVAMAVLVAFWRRRALRRAERPASRGPVAAGLAAAEK